MFGLYFKKKEGCMNEDDFDDQNKNDELDDLDEQNDGFGTYQDPNLDPDMLPNDDDDDDDNDNDENGYDFLEDPDEVENLSVAEIKEYAESIDESELNEDQEDGYEALMARSEQIDRDEIKLAIAQKAIDKYKNKVVQEKVKSPQAKQRLPKLYAYLAGTKALTAMLKPIVEAERK